MSLDTFASIRESGIGSVDQCRHDFWWILRTVSTLIMCKICATPGQCSCFLRSIGLHLLHTFLLELCDQSSQPDDLLVGFHLHHGLCNTLLRALSKLFRRFCTEEGLQIAQPIGASLASRTCSFALATCLFTREMYWRHRSRRSPTGRT